MGFHECCGPYWGQSSLSSDTELCCPRDPLLCYSTTHCPVLSPHHRLTFSYPKNSRNCSSTGAQEPAACFCPQTQHIVSSSWSKLEPQESFILPPQQQKFSSQEHLCQPGRGCKNASSISAMTEELKKHKLALTKTACLPHRGNNNADASLTQSNAIEHDEPEPEPSLQGPSGWHWQAPHLRAVLGQQPEHPQPSATCFLLKNPPAQASPSRLPSVSPWASPSERCHHLRAGKEAGAQHPATGHCQTLPAAEPWDFRSSPGAGGRLGQARVLMLIS